MLSDFATRADAAGWLHQRALALTLHGQHYTGYIFNDYAKMLETLRWMNTRIPGKQVLACTSSWDGRYYWDYPTYAVNDRMGGAAGFRTLVTDRGAAARTRASTCSGTHFFQHLSLPAPGRGSTGVHEAGFGRFNNETLMLNPNAIPTLTIVDDTCSAHRDTMAAVIRKARERAGI